jgi:hypothetical protein
LLNLLLLVLQHLALQDNYLYQLFLKLLLHLHLLQHPQLHLHQFLLDYLVMD